MLKHSRQGLELAKKQKADQVPFAPDCETSNPAMLTCRSMFARLIARLQFLVSGQRQWFAQTSRRHDPFAQGQSHG
jgi:hypothetical protein